MRPLISKLGEEVFVDAPEDIAIGLLQLVRVEGAQQLAQYLAVYITILLLG